MHKDEAAAGFLILSDPSRVKITKFLYLRGELSFDDLLAITGDEEKTLIDSLKMMENGSLIGKDGDMYKINRQYVDELLDFIRTPCGCCHH